MKKILSFMVFLIVTNSLHAQDNRQSEKYQTLSIIPYPASLKRLSGKFMFSEHTVLLVDAANPELLKIGETFAASLKETTGYTLVVGFNRGKNMPNTIRLTLKSPNDTLGAEGYSLAVRSRHITVKATGLPGIFYGLQTIRQLLPATAKKSAGSMIIPAMDIVDKPRFKWRGMMLDAGRYFYPVDFIKKYIDYLAMYKMNTFHWHLTEDHGWRIEIKKYPRLTQIGAWRGGTQFDHSPQQIDRNPHGGYYTQDQIREIVAYAAARFVAVVPEIEMPGHSLAALVAYPELSCTGGPFKMPLQWGIQKDVYCAGNEQTFKFLEDVLTEVTSLFPSPYIHIGGDECPKDRWKTCPKCQARIKAEGLKDEHGLQSYFIKRIEDFLLTKNKRIIGWDEILEGGLAPNASVMSWRGVQGGIAAAKLHHNVIMAPGDYTYFDHYQGEPYLEPVAIGGMTTLENVYSYEPVPSELSATDASYVQGAEGAVWSEYIHSPEKVEYMIFPRIAALAEVVWTPPQGKNWVGFKKRMEGEYQRYDELGIHYSKSAYNVWQKIKTDTINGKATVTLTTDSFHPEIHYTTDGSAPLATSTRYDHPFQIVIPGTIKAATFKNKKQLSKVSVSSVNPKNEAFETMEKNK